MDRSTCPVTPASARPWPDPANFVLPPRYVPSIYRSGAVQQIGRPHPSQVEDLLKSLGSYNERITHQPNDPQAWFERGNRMWMLNFPELAVGDLYKAKILEAHTPDDNQDLRYSVYGLLVGALQACHCQWDAAEVLEESIINSESWWREKATERFANLRGLLKRKEEAARALGGTPYELKDRVRDGGVLTVEYPWTMERHLTRAPELIKLINEELRGIGNETACYLGQSTFAKDSSEDMLGMFAARELRAGECILTDRTATGICSTPSPNSCSNCYARLPDTPTQATCCSESYCSAECLNLAMDTYHKVLCSKDFTWLQEPARGLTHNASPLRPLLMLRVLATCVQAGVEKSPLDHPLIARLKPLANKNHVDVFTLTESVIIPIKILEQLGVDVFANRKFDTDVLHSIWTRLANNKAGCPDPRLGFIDEVTPRLPLFNHSCDPNVEWRRENGSTTVRFFAIKPVKKGEELFCSYLNIGGSLVEERQEMLWPWFEGPCLCCRCEEDAKSLCT
jgi:hypothetical protein